MAKFKKIEGLVGGEEVPTRSLVGGATSCYGSSLGSNPHISKKSNREIVLDFFMCFLKTASSAAP